jgi:hypothetical protein
MSGIASPMQYPKFHYIILHPGLLVEWLTRFTYNSRRVCARVRSRPGHIQSCEYKERVCRMRLKTMVPCT